MLQFFGSGGFCPDPDQTFFLIPDPDRLKNPDPNYDPPEEKYYFFLDKWSPALQIRTVLLSIQVPTVNVKQIFLVIRRVDGMVVLCRPVLRSQNYLFPAPLFSLFRLLFQLYFQPYITGTGTTLKCRYPAGTLSVLFTYEIVVFIHYCSLHLTLVLYIKIVLNR